MSDAPWELREHDQWADWRAEPSHTGRVTKVPYIAAPELRRASSTNPDTWRSEAMARRYAVKNGMNGVGFMLSKSDPFIGFDLDDCVDEIGVIHPAALVIVKDLDTYVSYSPSRRGLRVWGYGHLNGTGFKGVGEWGGYVEGYGVARFMTETGWRVRQAPRAFRAVPGDLVETLRRSLGKPAETGRQPGTRSGHGKRNARRRDPRTTKKGERHNTVLSFVAALYAMGRTEIPAAAWEFNRKFPDPMERARFDKEVTAMLDWLERKAAASEAAFWEQSPVLRQIHDHAVANLVPPLAALAGVLARLCVAMPPWVKLPGRGAGENLGSLNSFFAIVGPPGVGKGQAISESRHAVEFGDTEWAELGLGSGEGLAHIFKERTQGAEQWHRRQALIVMGEGETAAKLGERSGSTLLPEMRGVFMAEKLGHEFATKSKRLHVPSHTYRAAILIAVQPTKAGPLLRDVEGGLPQRFVWFLSRAGGQEAAVKAMPTMHLSVPFVGEASLNLREDPNDIVLPVCAAARRTIDEDAQANMTWEGNTGVFAHRLFVRLKLAALLSLLHGLEQVTDEWWEAAEWLLLQSDTGRALCMSESWADWQARNELDAEAYANKEVKARAAVRASDEDADRAQCRQAMLNRLKKVGAEPERDLKKAAWSRVRQYADEELEKLRAEALVERFDKTATNGAVVVWIRVV